MVVLGVLSLGSVAFFSRIAAALAPSGESPRYSRGDIGFAAVLALWFLSIIYSSLSEQPPVTVRILVASAVLYGALVTSILCFMFLRGIDPIKAFGLRWSTWRSGLPIAAGAIIAAIPAVLLAQLVVAHFFVPNPQPQEIIKFLLHESGLRERIVVIFVAVVVAPVAEETIFRGYLYGIVRQFGGRWCAIGITSVLFAAIHVHLPSLVALFLLAIALGLVYEHTKSLWAPIFMHATFNGTMVTLALLWPDATR